MEILLFKKTTDQDLREGQRVCYQDTSGGYSKIGIISYTTESDGIKNYILNTSIGAYTADELKLVRETIESADYSQHTGIVVAEATVETALNFSETIKGKKILNFVTVKDEAGKEWTGTVAKKYPPLNAVHVLFADEKYNYTTSVSSQSTELSARDYFVGKYFDMGVYPIENMQLCIDINFINKQL